MKLSIISSNNENIEYPTARRYNLSWVFLWRRGLKCSWDQSESIWFAMSNVCRLRKRNCFPLKEEAARPPRISLCAPLRALENSKSSVCFFFPHEACKLWHALDGSKNKNWKIWDTSTHSCRCRCSAGRHLGWELLRRRSVSHGSRRCSSRRLKINITNYYIIAREYV